MKTEEAGLQQRCSQHRVRDAITICTAVGCISNDRMIFRSQMHSYLMCSSGEDFDIQQGSERELQ